MTLAALILGALCAAAAPDEPGESPGDLEAAFVEVQRRLEMQDVATARQLAEELLARHGDGPLARELLGRVNFYEGNYAKAVELLPAEGGFAKLAQSTLDEVKDYDQQESAHFIVRFAKGKDELLASYALDTLAATYRTVGQDLKSLPEQKVRVEFLSDPAALERT